MSAELRLALLVLGLCMFDATAILLTEVAYASAKFDGLVRPFQLLHISLLCIVPGALAARLLFPRYPTSHRDCLRIIAAFAVGSAVGHWPAFLSLPAAPMFGSPGLLRMLPVLVQSLLSYVLSATGVVYAMYWWRRNTTLQQELHRTRVGLLALKADRADAELLRLRAQIEPHFLFNTLATIVELFQTDTAAADRTLGLLIDYMSASRAHMRHQEVALGQELALASGYLAIQHMRMGPRLRHAIDVPPEFRGNRIPPAALLTLIENAIKHGLAPVPGGGSLHVVAHRDGGWLVVNVSDNGAGFQATSGRGLGLDNLRARLRGLYGAGASLRLVNAERRGVTATLRLPVGPPSNAPIS